MTQELFSRRHIGPSSSDTEKMLSSLGFSNLDTFMDSVIPESIRLKTNQGLNLGEPLSETQALKQLRETVSKNQIFQTFIGMGYSDCITPTVIQRNVLENPGWYTQYTAYQAEISQGRLEALLNFQTMVMELTSFEIANASLLDEATAAAEAMNLCFNVKERKPNQVFFVSERVHPQTLAVIQTRAEPIGVTIQVGDHERLAFTSNMMGALVQYPCSDGAVYDYQKFAGRAKEAGVLVVAAADLLGLVLLKPPGEWGADIAVGSTQRFGVPLGYGGPHAAYFATKDEYKRLIPGRIVGVSKDVYGKPAIRLALQTREQHIRRDRATSNICTAQVLLAVIASMYAVYHGPEGLKRIALRVHELTVRLAFELKKLGFVLEHSNYFDTLRIRTTPEQSDAISKFATSQRVNFRREHPSWIGIALDETTTLESIDLILEIFAKVLQKAPPKVNLVPSGTSQPWQVSQVAIPTSVARSSPILKHPVFSQYHSETEMLRYMRKLESKDLSLTTSMIPLGSCTMKLNATSEMFPVSWPEISKIHPFVPLEQVSGYRDMILDLEQMLCKITGFPAISLQPNAGSQGEYAGLLVIRKFHQSRGEGHRNVCLIPKSAHGTNPATAAMVGMKVVAVDCDDSGNVDLRDLQEKAMLHSQYLAALMVTYPSTHGVFEEGIVSICEIIHKAGGQVYLDGANLNAQIGFCRPSDYGADVCHLNLHKTFCIPHGGGGPGMGPIGVQSHLVDFLPTHSVVPTGGKKGIGPVAAAPWGSPSILPISWMYIKMMGSEGLKRATAVAILNANYVARQLENEFPILYKGKKGLVAHECIFDLRKFKSSGIEVEDVAKRLMDYGFHAPTISFPVPGTMMVEPTESESKKELDRFCFALKEIHKEIQEVVERPENKNHVLKNAPHTAEDLALRPWDRSYSKEKAVYPAPWLRDHKYWPSVNRIDNVTGDRSLVCSCPPMDMA